MSEEQVRRDVAILCEPGTRMVGSHGHGEAQSYLNERLLQLGLREYRDGSFLLPYSTVEMTGVNVVGRIDGANPELPAILIGAHYDTCGNQPGADDNASGVAALLDAAESLTSLDLERSVLIALFDAEEPPYFLTEAMGSIRFFEDQLEEKIHCALILELVGHDVPVPGLEDLLFITGMESNVGLEAILRNTQPDGGIRIVPTLNSYVGDLSDHFVFRVNHLPYLLLTCGRWSHYHADSDTPNRLNYQKIEAVSQYVCALTARAASSDLSLPFEAYDTTSTELHFLNKTITPVVSSMGLNMKLNTRGDIDRLVDFLLQRFEL